MSKILKWFQLLLIPARNEFIFIFFISFLLVNKAIQSVILNSDWLQDWSNYPILRIISVAVLTAYILAIIIQRVKYGHIIKMVTYGIVTTLVSVNFFLQINFKTIISPNILLLLSETNQKESVDFINCYWYSLGSVVAIIVAVSLVLVISLCESNKKTIRVIVKRMLPNPINSLFSVSFIILLFWGCCSVCSYVQLFSCKTLEESDDWNKKNYASNGIITSLLFSCHHLSLMSDVLKKAEYYTINLSSSKQKYIWEDEPMNLILVVGESFIKGHSSLYGYSLNTNPQLMSEKNRGNLFVFDDVISPSFLTSNSLRNMFSLNSVGNHEMWYDYPYFPAIFSLSGYHVFFWDNQYSPSSSGAYDFSLNAYLHNDKFSKMLFTKDQGMVSMYDGDLIKNFIEYFNKNYHTKQNLIIFHLQGQHNTPQARFPQQKRFMHFDVDDIQRTESWMTQDKKECIVHYDNCTYYNDGVIWSIIDYFRGSNAVMIYLSDHGEDVYDTGNRIGRKLNLDKNDLNVIRNLYEIPFFVWCSERYMTSHPKIVDAIRNAESKSFMSDNLCHMMMRLGGIESDQYSESRDLLSQKYICPPRIIEDGRDYDALINE